MVRASALALCVTPAQSRGARPNEGYAETTVALFLRDGRVLFTFARPRISDNERMDAGGLRFEVLEPGERLRTTFGGRLLDLVEPRQMADPRQAFRDNPTRPVAVDLVHHAVGPMYGSVGNADEDTRGAEDQFAKAHYEQHMAVSGTLRIDGEELRIQGYGLRDHSWGPRHWQAIESYQWLTMNFGPDLGAMVSVIHRDADKVRTGGVIIRDGEFEAIRKAEVSAEYEDNGLYHRTVTARIETASGETHEITGEVKGFIPLRNRREGLVTHIGEGMTKWSWGDRTGYGLSEFLQQV
jgi:hypothetical protein